MSIRHPLLHLQKHAPSIIGNPIAALQAYVQARNSAFRPNSFAVPSVLKACSNLGDVWCGAEVHGYAFKTGLIDDIFVQNSLIQMYSECRKVEMGRKVFEEMNHRDVVSWSTMIRCYTRNYLVSEALTVVLRMLWLSIKPSHVALLNMIGVFSEFPHVGVLQNGSRMMHGYAFRNTSEPDHRVQTALLHMYVQCGSTGSARTIFDCMTGKTTATWTSMIAGHVRSGDMDQGVQLFGKMREQEDAFPNEITMLNLIIACAAKSALEFGKWLHVYILKNHGSTSTTAMLPPILATALIDMYAKCRKVETARVVFDQIRMKDRNITVWTALIAGYAGTNDGLNQIIHLFDNMRKNKVNPNGTTMITILSACAEEGALDIGRWFHHNYIDKEEDIVYDLKLTTTLVDMYAKCGDIDAAHNIFSAATSRDTCLWNAMISGFARQGKGEDVLKLLRLMEREGVKPNGITFIGVLHGCSHTGLVSEGKDIFRWMEHEHGITPNIKHYGCMVDLLSRAGHLEEAHEILKTMGIKPNTITWGSFLSGCNIHKNTRFGEEALKEITELKHNKCGYNVLLSNIYAVDKRWDDVACVRNKTNAIGIMKQAGMSSINV
ncbi:hypothetical protein ZOSMA_162G00720 [Zostera marina]|uniref:Pentatricopeptide repeat-containing protein n=1 Tax=Zostera marina TaxID=29655 RepID=A0A0K9PU97_ZOSMR|nr:hypothetical protein ZOSMA_162G00720 [Zostera marina]